MKTFIVFTTVIIAITALSIEDQWTNFRIKHGKTYKDVAEEKLRHNIFQNNLKKIMEHNAKYEAGLSTYWMAVNQFTDMTEQEFSDMLKLQLSSKPKISGSRHIMNGTAPESIDWRQKDAVLTVKNQGGCGSCWAFSVTGALEGQNAIVNNKSIPLSEQELLDCSDNGDCSTGGTMEKGFDYAREKGIGSEARYPYEATRRNCRTTGQPIVKIKGYKTIDPTEEALKNAVGNLGPISVSMYADLIQNYGGGIFQSDQCYSDTWFLNHGVLAVGYGTDPSPFWIIKNSWGSYWGEDGYFRLARNADQCGIALDSNYPEVIIVPKI